MRQLGRHEAAVHGRHRARCLPHRHVRHLRKQHGQRLQPAANEAEGVPGARGRPAAKWCVKSTQTVTADGAFVQSCSPTGNISMGSGFTHKHSHQHHHIKTLERIRARLGRGPGVERGRTRAACAVALQQGPIGRHAADKLAGNLTRGSAT
jgi:hypothetical protein